MSQKPQIASSLASKTIAVPESRQLNVLSELFQRRGASVLRVPLIAIHDSPDASSISAWLTRFLETPPEFFIILTGEGLKRLIDFAAREGIEKRFLAALSATKKVCRGPKPNRVLREYGLTAELLGKAPTSQGVIETLESLAIENKTIGLQLYGEDPNKLLVNYLRKRGVVPDLVAPYIYASQEEDEKVQLLINSVIEGAVDAIAFTSQPQFRRLLLVAKKAGKQEELINSLNQLCVAAVGPIVERQLIEEGVIVRVVPEGNFFMKPLVTAIEKEFQRESR